jgi:hypothetical protein
MKLISLEKKKFEGLEREFKCLREDAWSLSLGKGILVRKQIGQGATSLT